MPTIRSIGPPLRSGCSATLRIVFVDLLERAAGVDAVRDAEADRQLAGRRAACGSGRCAAAPALRSMTAGEADGVVVLEQLQQPLGRGRPRSASPAGRLAFT